MNGRGIRDEAPETDKKNNRRNRLCLDLLFEIKADMDVSSQNVRESER